MSSSLTLAKLKASFNKTRTGPGWKQLTISYEELKEFLSNTATAGDSWYLVPKPEFKIRYYLHEYDLVGELAYIDQNKELWVDVIWNGNLPDGKLTKAIDPVKIPWNDIDWNGFSIYHNDGCEFEQVERG
jgi:hypothetical protein